MNNHRKVYVKGMVCQRCINAVTTGFEQAGVFPEAVQLGEVTLPAESAITDLHILEEKLKPLGFTLLQDKSTRMVGLIRSVIADVYSGEFDFPYRFRFSTHLSNVTGHPYDVMSAVFASVTQTTIEQYIINYRIQQVKQLLVYTPTNLADIAFKLGYSSVAHLSRQFKQKTGLTPSYFRQLRFNRQTAGASA